MRRALISVSDKTGLDALGRGLAGRGIELLSTGGTAGALREAGLEVLDVSAYTGFPEIMDGRVKTLHPKIHGGLLGRRDRDADVMAEHGIEPIDLLVVNLYPFEQTIDCAGVSLERALDNIDIGGPAMLRAAAKNHEGVAVVVDPGDYGPLLEALANGGVALELRRRLAAKAFAHTAAYDAAIAAYLTEAGGGDPLGERLVYAGRKLAELRYGENPHQRAAFYRDPRPAAASLAGARQLQGKTLSYNNIADTDAALECVRQFDDPACVIVKHANPCGVAEAESLGEAYDRAYATDPASAFGGIIAFNRRLDAATAREIVSRQFVEVIVAPALEPRAAEALAEKEKLRVLAVGERQPEPASPSPRDAGRDHRGDGHSDDYSDPGNGTARELDYKKVSGGMLVQEHDAGALDLTALEVVTEREPDEAELGDLIFAWRVVKFVKSNAIVFCRDRRTLGIGAGQMSRVYSTRIAAIKAADGNLPLDGAALASDAFFPFRDGIDSAAEHGARAVIQPGGSIRDEEVIAAANEHGMAMVFTGMRHFRH